MQRLALGACGLLFFPGIVGAAGGGPIQLSLWSVAPFVTLLLLIALLPLAAEHFWHSNARKALVTALVALPTAAYLVWSGPDTTERLLHGLGEYASFIILLAALYTVSGGIVLEGDIRGRPLSNVLLLGCGCVAANLIGTTGASMLLIRPYLRINRQRRHVFHLPIFFIFLVSNLGGLLTPLGDPPLFLGFLQGVPFFWTLQLWPQWLVANGAVLGIFLIWDTVAYLRESKQDLIADRRESQPLRLRGAVNLPFLGGVVGAVLFQSPAVGQAAAAWLGQFFACPNLTLVHPWGEAVMVAVALLSLLLTPRTLRSANAFTWGPILEVAILFVGIFVTMVPALAILQANGQRIGLDRSWQYFWTTGALSSFLDNAPTYMAFATLAASPGEIADLAGAKPSLLQAVSCGAVFMGANTYIGNGPNFMVKAIADESGMKTPSFFGYLLYSGLILLPVFALITYLFF